MTLLSPWLLAALAAVFPLTALHLRRRRRTIRVDSLMLWREAPRAQLPARRGRTLVLPLLLALELLVLVTLAVALARPAGGPARASARPGALFVVDTSARMQAPGRLAAARRLVTARLARLPAGQPVTLIAAGRPARILVARSRDRRRVRAAVASLAAGPQPADLRSGLVLAGGRLATRADRVTLVRAPEDPVPAVAAGGLRVAAVVVGTASGDRAVTRAAARCDPRAPARCRLFATLTADAQGGARTRVEVRRDERLVGEREVAVPAGGSADLVLPVPAGARLSVRLTGPGDAEPEDDTGWAVVPAATRARVTLVSARPATAPLARALAAVPGVVLRRRTPSAFARAPRAAADLLVLDGTRVPDPLPAVPAVLLVAPAAIPGGAVGAPLADGVVSAVAAGSPLLAGVDLAGLAVDGGAARAITPPAGVRPLVRAPGGPLLAAGTAHGQRLAILAFDPQRSTLPQLPALPLLAAALTGWATAPLAGPAPAAGVPVAVALPPGGTATLTAPGRGAAIVRRAPAGGGPVALRVPRPGLYRLRVAGPWGSRTTTLATSAAGAVADAGATAPVVLAPPQPAAFGGGPPPEHRGWALGAALVALLAAAALPRLRPRRGSEAAA